MDKQNIISQSILPVSMHGDLMKAALGGLFDLMCIIMHTT